MGFLNVRVWTLMNFARARAMRYRRLSNRVAGEPTAKIGSHEVQRFLTDDEGWNYSSAEKRNGVEARGTSLRSANISGT